jgi:hypothetical protein
MSSLVEDLPPKTQTSAERQSGGVMGKKYVYLLHYTCRGPTGVWCGMSIGVYSSRERAQATIARLRQQPGYRDYPEGFRVDERLLDTEYDDPKFFDRIRQAPAQAPPAQ